MTKRKHSDDADAPSLEDQAQSIAHAVMTMRRLEAVVEDAANMETPEDAKKMVGVPVAALDTIVHTLGSILYILHHHKVIPPKLVDAKLKEIAAEQGVCPGCGEVHDGEHDDTETELPNEIMQAIRSLFEKMQEASNKVELPEDSFIIRPENNSQH
jgi:hypothetical protein